MIDIGASFAALLASKSAITTLVPVGRIFNDRIPQGSWTNAIVFYVISETANMHLGGAQGLDHARMQVEAYARTRSEASNIAWTIWTEITGYSGVINQTHVMGVMRETGVNWKNDRVLAGTDQYRFAAVQDFRISYNSLETIGA